MPRTLRSLLACALGCLILLASPSGVHAVSPRVPPRTLSGGHGFSPAEALQALHRASRLMRHGRPSAGSRPVATDLTMALRDLHLARPALTGADRRAADRLLARPTATTPTAVAATGGTHLSCDAHFCLHYGASTTSSWASTTLRTLEHVWSVEVPLMGRAPLPDGGTSSDPENPDDRVDVFLQDLGNDGYYGYCSTDDTSAATQVAAYCALDDDFARRQFGGAAPLSSLRVTAAHEFFHAIQFAFDVSEDVWFMEGSATWAEDVVYDYINDNYQYLPSSPIRHPRTALDYGGGSYPYGSFIFFTYATARHGADAVRQFWDEAVGRRTSLQAIYAVIGARAWPGFFTTFGSWNTLPRHSYPERTGYPSPAWSLRKTLTARAATTGWHSVRMSHLGSSAMLVAPGARLAARKRLLVNIDGPPKSTGSAALIQRRYRDGRVTHTMVTLGAGGNQNLLIQFNHRVLSSIAVVVADTNRYGPARVFRVRAGLR